MSDTPNQPPRKQAPPAELSIGARPRPVTRLSRRALVAGSALGTALVFAALWYALGLHPLRLSGGPELYNTDAKPADAIANMRGTYADLTRPKPQPAPPVPQLGPPLPGDLGRPTIAPGGAAPDPDAERRRREREQAAGSAVMFTAATRPNPGATTPAPAMSDGTDAPRTGAADQPPIPGDDLTVQNGQSRKEAFVNARVDQAIYSPQHLQTPKSPYQLMAGTVIAAALVTGIDSDLPGQVVAQVNEDTFDSVTGRYLLLPQGTRLIGKYDSQVAYGQERVLLIWTRLVMPDGSSIVLDNLPATDTQGHAGLEDGVDYHTWRLLKGIALSTLLGVGSELATNGGAQTSGQGNIIVSLRQSGDNSANQAGQRIVSKDLAIQPTLTIRPGFPVRVLVNRDIVLRPYQGR